MKKWVTSVKDHDYINIGRWLKPTKLVTDYRASVKSKDSAVDEYFHPLHPPHVTLLPSNADASMLPNVNIRQVDFPDVDTE